MPWQAEVQPPKHCQGGTAQQAAETTARGISTCPATARHLQDPSGKRNKILVLQGHQERPGQGWVGNTSLPQL